ncbi:MAG: alpha-glucosidase [Bacteroidota bacterium]
MERSWWKEGVIYQIYPRSFCDSNNDGIGDLPGIHSKLDYLAQLGIDIIWLSPVYDSPNADNGYDIRNYYDIMAEFGTMEDFDSLLAGIHERGMKLVMDLVVNHTSDEHAWFQEAKSSPTSEKRDYYIWKKGKAGGPPNNWQSFFGGSAWEYDEASDEYYLHYFAVKQPDLNWENQKVRQEVYSMMKFWLDKGVDGFRMDVIPLISKRLEYADTDISDFGKVIERVYANGPRVHEFLQEMNKEVISKYDMLTVGEGVGIISEMAADYVGKNRGELHMIFHFGHMFLDHGPKGRLDRQEWTLETFIGIFEEWDKAMENTGWNSLYLGNHDFPRMVDRFGDAEKYWKASAKLLAMFLMAYRGTPTIYQGDELGMINVPFTSIEEFDDIELMNAWHEQRQEAGFDEDHFLAMARIQGRDNARTPFQWSSESHAGFTSSAPWIKVNPSYQHINAAQQVEDKDSILAFYKELLAFRKQWDVLVYGDLTSFPLVGGALYGFERKKNNTSLRVVLNFYSLPQKCPQEWIKGSLIFSNYEGEEEEILRPWEGRYYSF